MPNTTKLECCSNTYEGCRICHGYSKKYVDLMIKLKIPNVNIEEVDKLYELLKLKIEGIEHKAWIE